MRTFLLTAASFAFLAGTLQAADIPKTDAPTTPGTSKLGYAPESVATLACNIGTNSQPNIQTMSNATVSLCLRGGLYNDKYCAEGITTQDSADEACQQHFQVPTATSQLPSSVTNCKEYIELYNEEVWDNTHICLSSAYSG